MLGFPIGFYCYCVTYLYEVSMPLCLGESTPERPVCVIKERGVDWFNGLQVGI